MNLRDVYVIEGEEPTDEMGYYKSVQHAINSGAWSLQGSYGRTMMGAIESGHCVLGRNSARDYWGNRIPARDEVMPGTKGSVEYVAERMGAEWAEAIAAE